MNCNIFFSTYNGVCKWQQQTFNRMHLAQAETHEKLKFEIHEYRFLDFCCQSQNFDLMKFRGAFSFSARELKFASLKLQFDVRHTHIGILLLA